MKSSFVILALALGLAACGGGSNPLTGDPNPSDGGGGGGGGTDTPLSETSVSTLDGTSSPSADKAIRRVEKLNKGPDDTDVGGNGYANEFAYDSATDTFSVNNLGFDGDNSYKRGKRVADLGPFQVYESANVYQDDVTGAPIGQFQHRAIYGVSRSGEAKFAIVRTGSYAPYGFGGFMYERNGKVTLPTPGTQAQYTGSYAAIRDFSGAGGLEYATGDMQMAIDLRDFDKGNAVQGAVYNRVIYNANGRDITANVLAAINTKDKSSLTELPAIVFTVGPGVMDKNGEIEGYVTTPYSNDEGQALDLGSGKYYAVLSGNDEVVGVIVTESTDRRGEGVTVRETGGFILYRP